MPRETDFKQKLCADIDGFSVHAAVRCGADDRQALEQLWRYITRRALARGSARCGGCSRCSDVGRRFGVHAEVAVARAAGELLGGETRAAGHLGAGDFGAGDFGDEGQRHIGRAGLRRAHRSVDRRCKRRDHPDAPASAVLVRPGGIGTRLAIVEHHDRRQCLDRRAVSLLPTLVSKTKGR